MQNTPRHLTLIACILASISSYAFNAAATEKQADSSITELYHRLGNMPTLSMPERIDWISQQFKNAPYTLGSLGEGANARYDDYPQYRVDSFDCDTYVNTVIALALADSLASFQQCAKMMRYTDGKVSYLERNHFTGLDWNQNKQQRGIFKDITQSIHDQHQHPVAQIASAWINKPKWYAHHTLSNIRLQHADKAMQQQRLNELKIKGAQLKAATETVPYLPFSALFKNKEKPDLGLFSQIPHGSIIEIVRPDWDLRKTTGTALNVSHLGFAIWKNNILYFREASSTYGKVVDVPLIDYLLKAQESPTIKGINVQIVLPEKPLADCT